MVEALVVALVAHSLQLWRVEVGFEAEMARLSLAEMGLAERT